MWLGGEARRCRLTLGSLAELEAALGAGSLIALIERFETGQFTAADLVQVLLAGLRGGGWTGDAQTLAEAEIGGGLSAAAAVAARLLLLAFAPPSPTAPKA